MKDVEANSLLGGIVAVNHDVGEVPLGPPGLALLGEQAPETSLPPLPGLNLPGLNSADFQGKVTVAIDKEGAVTFNGQTVIVAQAIVWPGTVV